MISHPLFQQALPVIQALQSAGFEAYFVGGAVRDFWLKRPVQDVDIATSALPEEVKAVFDRTVDIGIEHGTVLVLHNDGEFEVTTFRTESTYSDFRRPDGVQFVRSLEDDLQRRDFTMNAMAMTADGKIIDPFHGKTDLQKKNIRTVGEAHERFSEDALRMMRAARFVSQLSFQLDKSAELAMKQSAPLLAYVAVERKQAEMDKLLSGENASQAIDILIQTGLYKYLPGFESHQEVLENWAQLPLKTFEADQAWIAFICLADMNQPDRFLKQWRFSQKRIKRIEKSVQMLKRLPAEGLSNKLLYEAGLTASIDSAVVAAAFGCPDADIAAVKQKWHSLPIKNRQDLAVSGTDLLEWSKQTRGPWIRVCFEAAEQAVLQGTVKNKRNEIERWLRLCNLL